MNYDLPRDQARLHARIGFETPMMDVLKRFVTHGEAVIGRPRPSATPEFERFQVPTLIGPNSRVPVIFMRSGYVRFGLGAWSAIEGDDQQHIFRQAQRRQIGCPGLVPASFIEMAVPTDQRWQILRIRRNREPLFIGCMIIPGHLGDPAHVLPLVRAAGPELAKYVEWEMLRIPIHRSPCEENFAFISRVDRGQLQIARGNGAVFVESVGTFPCAA